MENFDAARIVTSSFCNVLLGADRSCFTRTGVDETMRERMHQCFGYTSESNMGRGCSLQFSGVVILRSGIMSRIAVPVPIVQLR